MWIYDPKADYLQRDNYAILTRLLKDEKPVKRLFEAAEAASSHLPRHESLACAQWWLAAAIDDNLASTQGLVQ
jgi:hypothetical protein